MSDISQVALTPLHHVVKTGKKRKRNFRPTSSKNASAKSQPPNIPLVSNNTNEVIDRDEAEEDEIPFESEFHDELEQEVKDEVVSEPVPKPSVALKTRTRPKKSKKIAVSVGPSRPPTTDAFDAVVETPSVEDQVSKGSHLGAASGVPTAIVKHAVEDTSAMDAMDAAILARDQGDAPRLNSFCTSFKVKRRAKGALGEGRETGTVTTKREHRSNETRDQPSSISGPVVQIVNGEIVLQESSVVINRDTSKMGDEDASVVEEEAQLAVVGATANSFTNRNKSQRWTADQTKLFYHALRQVGTDFGTMEAFFDGKRTRKQLKRKYQAEMTRNPLLIEKALDPSTRFDLDLSVFQLSEEEKKKIDEPRVPLTEDNISNSLGGENRFNSNSLNQSRVPATCSDGDESEQEALEEDAIEERNQYNASQQESKLTEPPLEPTFHHEEDTFDDPLFGGEENDDTAVVSLIPALTTNKKKPNFRSLRAKKKKQ